MAVQAIKPIAAHAAGVFEEYLRSLSLIECLHRLLLDVIKDEFERLKISDINAVQALLVYNIGTQEVSAGELRARGYYQGSNVSYNLKKLGEKHYIYYNRCRIDRRSVKIRASEKGLVVRDIVADLFRAHAHTLAAKSVFAPQDLVDANHVLKKIEKFWTGQIRYIY